MKIKKGTHDFRFLGVTCFSFYGSAITDLSIVLFLAKAYLGEENFRGLTSLDPYLYIINITKPLST